MHKPEGYKELLVYRRAEELRLEIQKLTSSLPYSEQRRKVHLNDSARSVKQNIVEGWKRSTTQQYYEFLSFSLGSLAEIKEDIKDLYQDKKINKNTFDLFTNKCQELDYLLNRLKISLKAKMEREGTLPQKEKLYERRLGINQQEKDFDRFLESQGLKKLANGQYIQGETGDKGEKG